MSKLGEHAVVLGASMGGLLAARVLAEFYRTVTVVERDVLPDDSANRRGVPQGRHVHALITRGAQILNELFPGLLDELVTDGARVLDGEDLTEWYLCYSGHLLARSGRLPVDPDYPDVTGMYLASRPFLECHVRRRLQQTHNVTILAGHDVAGLTSTADHTRVTGARVVDRDGGAERELAADLVVDAMGRGAHTPNFLESLGYPRPVEDHIVMHTTYVSQLLQIPPGTLREIVTIISPVPGRPTGLFLFGYEHDTWMFTVHGMTGREPPLDLAGMLAFAAEYAPDHLLTAVRAGEPIGGPVRHRMPSSQWRRYDKLREWPDGLLVCGDAICSFNPIYGQGMTVAALEAIALRDCLRRGSAGLPRRYFRAAAKSIGVAWRMGPSSDLMFPEVEGRRTRSLRIGNRLADWTLTACETDREVILRFFAVNGLVDPPVTLLHPGFAFRVAAANFRRRKGSIPQQRAGAALPT